MNVLITGGAGFIGSHTADKLIDAGFNVVVVDRADPLFKNDRAVYYHIDLNGPKLAAIFEKHSFDYVIHLAAQASVSVSVADPIQDAQDNIMSSVRVIELCKKHNVKKIVVSSSAALYAVPQYLPVDEKHPVSFLSPYAVSKSTMEDYVRLSGLDYIIFRYANVYGPRQNPYGEAGVVSIFIDRMINGCPIEIHGDGEQTRDFVYVEDIAEVNKLALLSANKNKTLNVSTKTKTSVNELFEIIRKNTDYVLEPKHTAPRAGDIKDSVLDNAEVTAVLGFAPKTPLNEGVAETVRFFQKMR